MRDFITSSIDNVTFQIHGVTQFYLFRVVGQFEIGRR